jgi:branched-chain amino acid transport system ATP-binding protein
VRENIAVGAFLRLPKRRDALELAEEVGQRLGLGPQLDKPAAALTVAGRKRLEVARALATRPRILLLDEVLAGLNPSELRDFLPVLQDIRVGGVTILMIEHVMQAVMSLCEHVHVISGGRIIASGEAAEVVGNPAVIEAYLGPGAAQRLAGHA